MPGGPTRAVTLTRRILSTAVQVPSAVTAALVLARPQRLVHELADDTEVVYQGTVQQGLTAGPAQTWLLLCGLRSTMSARMAWPSAKHVERWQAEVKATTDTSES